MVIGLGFLVAASAAGMRLAARRRPRLLARAPRALVRRPVIAQPAATPPLIGEEPVQATESPTSWTIPNDTPEALEPIAGSEAPSFFRREALEFQSGRSEGNTQLRVASTWAPGLYWLVLALVVVGLALSSTLRTDVTITGPAVIDGRQGTFVALLPSTPSGRLQPGDTVLLDLDDAPARRLSARVTGSALADDADARSAGLRPLAEPAVLVQGDILPDAPAEFSALSPRVEGRVVVVVGTERLIGVFIRGFRQMLGQGHGS
jgi:hypothetical protein